MTFRYVNAGHNPPILLNESSKDIILLKARGIALGAIENIELQEVETKLAQGDEIVLYTDGVTEAVNEKSEQFSMERLIKVIRENPTLSAKDLMTKIQYELNLFVNSRPQFDDVTLMILKVTNKATEGDNN